MFEFQQYIAANKPNTRSCWSCKNQISVMCPWSHNLQVFTKYCVFSSSDMSGLNKASISAAVDVSRKRLGVDKIDLLQFYWADYDYGK